MSRRKVSAVALRRSAVYSTRVSARLEHRELPDGYVRSPEVEKFLESVLPKA